MFSDVVLVRHGTYDMTTYLKACKSRGYGYNDPCVYSYFSDNQYPDEAKREEIATACNAVIQKPGIIHSFSLFYPFITSKQQCHPLHGNHGDTEAGRKQLTDLVCILQERSYLIWRE